MNEVEKKYQHLFEHDEDGKLYITEYNLGLVSDVDKDALLNYLKENNVPVFEDYKTRSKRVHDHELEFDSNDSFSQFQLPRMSEIKYDESGNIIFENYTELEKYVDEELIPNHVVMKISRTKDGKKYYPSIRLMDILALRLSEAENNHVMSYLKTLGIPVAGIDSTFEESDNYTFVLTHKNIKIPGLNLEQNRNKELYDKLDSLNAQLNKLKGVKEKQEERNRLQTEIKNIKNKIRNESEMIEKKMFEALHDESVSDTDKSAIREQLIVSNMRLAQYFTWRYNYGNQILSQDELESFGMEGLIKAVDKYREDIGCPFGTYARYWIRGRISAGVKYHFRNNENIYRFLTSKRLYEQETGLNLKENPEILDDILEFMSRAYGYSDEYLNYIRTLVNQNLIWLSLVDLDSDIDEFDKQSDNYSYEEKTDDNLILDVNSLPDETDYEELAINNADKDILRKRLLDVLDTLTDREREVLKLRYGFKDGKEHSLGDVGVNFGVSKERVRQIEAKALRKMRHPTRSHKIKIDENPISEWRKMYNVWARVSPEHINDPEYLPYVGGREDSEAYRMWLEEQRKFFRDKPLDYRHELLSQIGLEWNLLDNKDSMSDDGFKNKK